MTPIEEAINLLVKAGYTVTKPYVWDDVAFEAWITGDGGFRTRKSFYHSIIADGINPPVTGMSNEEFRHWTRKARARAHEWYRAQGTSYGGAGDNGGL